MQLQHDGHDTLPWLIFFLLDRNVYAIDHVPGLWKRHFDCGKYVPELWSPNGGDSGPARGAIFN